MMLDFIETSGADIESAVMRALSELGVTRDQVRVDVIEEPLRRPLGLGTRPARVRVTVVSRPTSAEPVASVSQPQVPATPKVIAAPPPADPPIADAITASVKPPEAKPIPAVPRHFDADDEEHDASSTPAELDEEADMSTDILRT